MARFEAVVSRFLPEGIAVHGMETSNIDVLNTWSSYSSEGPADHLISTLFNDSPFETLTPRQIHNRVFSHLDELQPDAIATHSYSLPDARACLEWAIRNERKVVLMTDSRSDDVERSLVKEKLKSLIVTGFDAALVAGSQSAEYIASLGVESDRVFWGYDVVNNAHFTPRNLDVNDSQWRKHHPYFLSSTRFIPRKNIDGLVKAYADYCKRVDDPWRLVVIGDGPTMTQIVDLRDQHNLTRLVLAGHQSYGNLPEFYFNASAFVHPAFSDQWALVVNEAMAAGLPVIVSNQSGSAADLVDHGVNGFTFDAHNLDALSDYLQMVSSPDFALGEFGAASRKRIANWTTDHFAENLLRALKSCDGRTTGKRQSLLILRTLRLVARRSDSFHSVEA